jgi:hypothetical protein
MGCNLPTCREEDPRECYDCIHRIPVNYGDCSTCDVEPDCGYEHKPTECHAQRKFTPKKEKPVSPRNDRYTILLDAKKEI